jgi:hypothetical protein
LLGAGILFPWNVLITETAYFNMRFHTPPYPQMVRNSPVTASVTQLCFAHLRVKQRVTQLCFTHLNVTQRVTQLCFTHLRDSGLRVGCFAYDVDRALQGFELLYASLFQQRLP